MLKNWLKRTRLLLGRLWRRAWRCDSTSPPPIALGQGTRPYLVERVEEVPELLDHQTLYVVGEGPHQLFVAMICPCGCGETLMMSLLADVSPHWLLALNSDNAPTLEPSVLRKIGCKSHFFLRRGIIVWCPR